MISVKMTSIAGNSIVAGKTWFKKNLKNATKYHRACVKCGNHVYAYDKWQTADGRAVILCLTCGFLHNKAPAVKTAAVKKKKRSEKPAVTVKKKETTAKKKTVAVEKQVKPEKVKIEPVKESKTAVDPKTIDISEIKGIGKATAEQLRLAGINTAADMLALDSKTIATKIGRKSDTQVKKWLTNLNEILK
ncbi:MAG: hypothetical protein ACTSP4_05380 [Candidatus Hodarchaeales archaeon]